MRTIRAIRLSHCVTYLTVLAVLFGVGGQVRAQGYDLSILVNGGNPVAPGDPIDGKMLTYAVSPRLNDNGLVGFQGGYVEGSFSREGNFTYDGTTGTFLISVSENGPPEVCDGKTLDKDNRSLSPPRLNNNGLAAFFARIEGAGHGIFAHDGTTCMFNGPDPGDFVSGGGLIEINDNNFIAHGVSFGGAGPAAIIMTEVLPGGPVHTVVAQKDDVVDGKTITNTNNCCLRMNNNDFVVFNGEFTDGINRIVRTNLARNQSILAEPGDVCGGITLTSVLKPEINDNDDVVFTAAFAGGEGLFRVTGGACTVVVKEGDDCGGAELDDIDVDRQHQMNNDGVVVFAGNFAGGSRQLFSQSDTECVVVAKPGDPVDGTTIDGGLNVAGSSINNSGIVALHANLDGGGTPISAILLATPIPSDPCTGAVASVGVCKVNGVPNQDCQGGPGDDVIIGFGGDDIILGGGGNDVLKGAQGTDLLCGEDGDDTLIGGHDNDILVGGAGEDVLKGESGEDELLGGEDADVLLAGSGNDVLFGEGGDDVLKGEAGEDEIDGGSGADDIKGGTNNDTLSGGSEDDSLFGEAGDDILNGNDGMDTLNGGGGMDSCTNGPTLIACE